MESSKRYMMSVLAVVLLGFIASSTEATNNIMVGGKNGWVPNPSESYATWAARGRFNIGDTLIFKYKKGQDSVLVVSKEDYDACNTGSPIKSMNDGESKITFDRSGPFYFISGNQGSCQKGQKIYLVVITPKTSSPPTPLAPSSSSPSIPPSSDFATPPTAPVPSTPSKSSSTTNSIVWVSALVSLLVVSVSLY
ncbi:hypothetical protein MKW94_020530 [Papaver nudicaule]|uniref:Phytocyanin domain-containing protein n=1 Tax=Papaver nudicaule TaxID=74823 RepID=A0AA41SC85_PAPNU|nr:hypothetical protein [Papaver nudicaule]